MEFSNHQWKLIFSSVRKQQQKEVPGSGWYKEYDEILNQLYPITFDKK
jgi:hypothetical protein